MLLQTESCLISQKWSPYKVKGPFPMPVCTRKQKSGPSSADQAYCQLQQPPCTVSCNSRHVQSATTAAMYGQLQQPPCTVSYNSRHVQSATTAAMHGQLQQPPCTVSYNSRHARSARAVDPPSFPCPTLSASAEPIFKIDCAN